MLQPNPNWNEFDWEAALRDSDASATHYFRLLQRFSDLPGANELISRHMGPEFDMNLPDCELDCDSCERRWDCDALAGSCDWHGDCEEEQSDEAAGADATPVAEEDSEPLFYESDPAFVALRRSAVGWCNLYAAILPPDSRVLGLRVLFHIGRALANLGYSIDDGVYEQPAGSIAFAKRSLAQINLALGGLNQLMSERTRLRDVLVRIRTDLVAARSAAVDHLQRIRSLPGSAPP